MKRIFDDYCQRIQSFRLPTAIFRPTVVAAAGLIIWWLALLLVDYLTGGTAGPFTTNLHIGLWIYLVQFFFQTFKANFASPASWAPDQHVVPQTRLAAEVAATVPRVVVQVIVRMPLLILSTALMMAWCGDAPIIRVASVFPSILLAIVPNQPKLIRPIQMDSHIRGTHLGSQSEAQLRAAQLIAEEESHIH